eukprot:6482048-Amphidinium_carterae.1
MLMKRAGTLSSAFKVKRACSLTLLQLYSNSVVLGQACKTSEHWRLLPPLATSNFNPAEAAGRSAAVRAVWRHAPDLLVAHIPDNEQGALVVREMCKWQLERGKHFVVSACRSHWSYNPDLQYWSCLSEVTKQFGLSSSSVRCMTNSDEILEAFQRHGNGDAVCLKQGLRNHAKARASHLVGA